MEASRGAFVGRAHEQAVLAHCIDGCRSHGPTAIAVVGEPGCGKTFLVERAVRDTRGVAVLRAVGRQGSSYPYGGLRELLTPVIGDLGLLDEQQHDDLAAALDGAQRTSPPAVLAAAASLVGALASLQPLVLVIDDLPWLDDPTTWVLVGLLSQLRGDRFCLLATGRYVPPALESVPVVQLLALGELAHDEAVSLATSLGLAPVVAGSLIGALGGNPLAVALSCDLLTDAQRTGHDPLSDPPLVGPRIVDAFVTQLSGLPARTRGALVLLGLGQGLPIGALRAALDAMGITGADLSPAVEAAIIDADRLRFRHPLVRSCVVESAGIHDQLVAHAQLAAALDPDTDQEQWATHLAASAHHPDHAVAEALARAALSARNRGATSSAIGYLERAALFSDNDLDRCHLLAQAGWLGMFLGDSSRGKADIEAALVLSDDPDLACALEIIGSLPVLFDRGIEASCRLVSAISTAHAASSPAQALFGAVGVVQNRALEGRFDLVRSAAALCGGLASTIPALDPFMQLVVTFVQWTGRRLTGETGRSDNPVAALTGVCRHWAQLEPGPPQPVSGSDPTGVLSWYGAVTLADEDWGLATEILGTVFERNQIIGWHSIGGESVVWWIECLLRTGRWSDAFLASSAAVDLYARRIDDGRTTWLLAAAARVNALLGRTADAEELTTRASHLNAAFRSGAVAAWLDHAGAVTALSLGHPDMAVHHLARVAAWAEIGEAGHPGVLWWEADYIEALIDTGAPDHASARLVDLEHRAQRMALTAVTAMCHLGWALLAPADQMDDAFAAALRLLDGGPCQFETARIELRYAERLSAEGRRAAARTMAGSAAGRFLRLGAELWAARAALTIDGDLSPAAASLLSDQELRVATLVCRGLANKQVARELGVSSKTVEFHLAKVYRKLDVTSRVALTRVLTHA